MVRTYKQKNSYLPGSKISNPVFLAILTCYIKGRTTVQSAKLVSRWAEMRGKKGVSRQAVQSLYERSGRMLWMLAFEDRKGTLPDETDTPEDDLAAIRGFVYDPDRIADIEKVIAKSRLLQDAGMKAPDLSSDEVVQRLRDLSVRMRGLPARTFYVQWSRVYWLVQVEKSLKLTEKQVQARVLEKLLVAYLSPPEWAPKIDQEERVEYFTYGRVLARIHWDRQNVPVLAERFCYETKRMIEDPKILEEIYIFSPDGIRQISEVEFWRVLKDFRK